MSVSVLILLALTPDKRVYRSYESYSAGTCPKVKLDDETVAVGFDGAATIEVGQPESAPDTPAAALVGTQPLN
jgi:hypothetical protein